MKVLLDTNIIMDALQERQPFDVQAKEIMQLAQDGTITAMFTANAAADIFYLFSKARDIEAARSALEFLLDRFGAVDVSHDDCVAALKIPYDDFEDALAVVCAAKIQADFIITRDADLLNALLPVQIISPSGFLSALD